MAHIFLMEAIDKCSEPVVFASLPVAESFIRASFPNAQIDATEFPFRPGEGFTVRYNGTLITRVLRVNIIEKELD